MPYHTPGHTLITPLIATYITPLCNIRFSYQGCYRDTSMDNLLEPDCEKENPEVNRSGLSHIEKWRRR